MNIDRLKALKGIKDIKFGIVAIHQKVLDAIADVHDDIMAFNGMGILLADHQVKLNITSGDICGSSCGNYDPILLEILIYVSKSVRYRDQNDSLMIGDTQVGIGSLSRFLTIEQVYSHEYGHFVRDELLNSNQHFKWYKLSKRLPKQEQKKVSLYGSADSGELFSESFSIYVHPKYKCGILPNEIESFLKEVIGDNKR